MQRNRFFQPMVWWCIFNLCFMGCANTIPSRADNAVPIHPAALYPVRVAVMPFTDLREKSESESAKRISWPSASGRIDYYGESVGAGLAAHVAEYLMHARVFQEVRSMNYLQNDEALTSLGYRAVLNAKIRKFNGSYEVPKWVLIIAAAPNPLFFILPGITLLPLVAWPKRMEFDVALDEVTIKDLKTGVEDSLGSVEVNDRQKKMSPHVTPKWYLGEAAERLSKKLVGKFSQAQLKF